MERTLIFITCMGCVAIGQSVGAKEQYRFSRAEKKSVLRENEENCISFIFSSLSDLEAQLSGKNMQEFIRRHMTRFNVEMISLGDITSKECEATKKRRTNNYRLWCVDDKVIKVKNCADSQFAGKNGITTPSTVCDGRRFCKIGGNASALCCHPVTYECVEQVDFVTLKGWRNETNGLWYKYFRDEVACEIAESNCKRYGATLISIDEGDEHPNSSFSFPKILSGGSKIWINDDFCLLGSNKDETNKETTDNEKNIFIDPWQQLGGDSCCVYDYEEDDMVFELASCDNKLQYICEADFTSLSNHLHDL